MKIALLTISSLSLVASVGTLVVMVKVAVKLNETEARIKTDVETFKQKTDRNLIRIRSMINTLEF